MSDEIERLKQELEMYKRQARHLREDRADQGLIAMEVIEDLKAQLKDVAERQREIAACMVENADDGVPLQCLADAIRAAPLVTEDKQ